MLSFLGFVWNAYVLAFSVAILIRLIKYLVWLGTNFMNLYGDEIIENFRSKDE